MTAANVWVDGTAAYLLTDRGSFHDDGTLLYTGGKFGVHDRLRLVFGHAGMGHADMVDDLLEVIDQFPDQSSLLAAMPEIIRAALRMFEESAAAGMNMTGHTVIRFHMILALWSQEANEPQAYAIGSEVGSIAGSVPYKLRRVRSCCSPPVADGPHPSDGGFDPERDGRLMIEAQRRYRDEGGASRVAGGADLVIVDATGIRTSTLCTWPDRIGEMVNG